MKKLVSMLVLMAMLLSCTAMAETLLPYTGDEVVYEGYAADLGITRVRVVANKVRNAEDEAFLKSRIPEDALLGFIHYNPGVIEADRQGASPYDVSPSAVEEIRAIKARMDSEKN